MLTRWSQFSGHGVGLNMARLHMRLMGGSLQLCSLPGAGTTVVLEFERHGHVVDTGLYVAETT
jgi:signal transduction histidine kinase